MTPFADFMFGVWLCVASFAFLALGIWIVLLAIAEWRDNW